MCSHVKANSRSLTQYLIAGLRVAAPRHFPFTPIDKASGYYWLLRKGKLHVCVLTSGIAGGDRNKGPSFRAAGMIIDRVAEVMKDFQT